MFLRIIYLKIPYLLNFVPKDCLSGWGEKIDQMGIILINSIYKKNCLLEDLRKD